MVEGAKRKKHHDKDKYYRRELTCFRFFLGTPIGTTGTVRGGSLACKFKLALLLSLTFSWDASSCQGAGVTESSRIQACAD